MLNKLFLILAAIAEVVLRLLTAKDKQAGREEIEKENEAELERRKANAKSVDNLSLDELLELRRKGKSNSGNLPDNNKE